MDLARLYVERLSWLLGELGGTGARLVEHQFSEAGIPTFVLMFDRGGHRARFLWNAEAATLEVQFATAPDAPLVHDAFISLPGGEGVFEEIASEVENLLAI